jgi:hypothetical protein
VLEGQFSFKSDAQIGPICCYDGGHTKPASLMHNKEIIPCFASIRGGAAEHETSNLVNLVFAMQTKPGDVAANRADRKRPTTFS